MDALRVENLTKVYKKNVVLDSISFSVENNKTTVILGLDKSGKSTLTKILSLIQKPTSGNIYYFDNLKVASDNYTNDVSLMPETLGLSEHLTAFENIQVMALTRHFKTKGIKELVIEYMKKYNLYDRYDDKVKTLSVSLKKLLSFVITIITDSKVIILDEPFKDIDIKTKRMMIEFIKELKGIKTFIITSELPDVAVELADSVYILEDAKLNRIDDFSNQKELENRLLNGGCLNV